MEFCTGFGTVDHWSGHIGRIHYLRVQMECSAIGRCHFSF